MYEYFSHEVWSLWMMGLSLWPLLLGVVPALACGALRAHVCRVARDLWSCGVATLTVGSCLRGVLEIYGTTSMLVEPYMPVGLALLALGLAAGVLGSLREDRDRRKSIAASHRL
ncbi:MAG: hypothetical protein J6D34_06210 [Atopobiaceae bacterium]|nr:hypothetical protein [Atopobiaceae bacterium]